MQRVIGKMIIHFVFNLKKKVKDMKDKIKSITHIQKDESMKVKSIKGKKQNKKKNREFIHQLYYKNRINFIVTIILRTDCNG